MNQFYETQVGNIEIDSLVSQFTSYWDSGRLSETDKNDISAISRYFAQKRVNKTTTFFYFLRTTMLLKDQSQTNYNIWIKLFKNYSITNTYSTKEVSIYTKQIYHLITEDYIFWSKTSKWKYINGNYAFNYDEDENYLKIKFTNIQLESYYFAFDTLHIKSVNGTLDILKSKWVGTSGKVTWEKYGLPSGQVYAKLHKYNINLKHSKYSADSVTYKNSQILKYEIQGKLIDEASSWGRKNNAFPVFVSYKTDLNTKKDNIHYKSGITMKGKKVLYSGTGLNKAEIKYLFQGKTVLEASSKEFYESGGVLNSNDASINIYIAGSDTVSHPSAKLNISETNIKITRQTKGAGNRPFFNPYQSVEIEADELMWNIKDSLIYFLSQDSKDKHVRSSNYFTKTEFNKVKMYETTNPLFSVKRYATKLQSNTFNVDDYSFFVKKDPVAMRQRFIGLWYDGYVDYNTETHQVIVLKKLYDYIEFFFNRKDYDVINLPSVGQLHSLASNYRILNCKFNTKTNDLYIFGVEGTSLSSTKRTGFLPSGGMVIMKKNRDMMFGGKLRAGLADIHAKSFYFSYSKFEVTFESADTLAFSVITYNPESNSKQLAYLNSAVEGVSGKIRIDLKSNKSGKKNIPIFPILISKDTSYVYYDKKTVYDRETFMFKNYPFTKDSLLYINERELKIDGIMLSGGILPDFEETLTVQEDYSLGFRHRTPEGGLKLFGGKTTLSSKQSSFDSFIKLSNQGLQANGSASWFNTTIKAKNFNLYPDSLSALADEMIILKDTTNGDNGKFPDVTGKLVYTKWDSKNDFITYTTTENPVEMYNGKVKVHGTVTYKPNGLYGSGNVNVDRGTLYSKEFIFKNNSLIAEKANMKIKDKTEDKDQLLITDMKSYIDMNSGKGVFVANNDSSNINFIENKYLNYPKHFVWDTKSNDVNVDYNTSVFTSSSSLDSAYLIDICKFDKSIFYENEGSSKFVSTARGQNGLTFYGTKATFSSENKDLETEEVKKIIVADIEVKPSTSIVINKDGKIGKLFNTTIKARGRHNISDVDITIMSKNQYVASSGTYIYYDQNRTSQNIKFDSITYSTHEQATIAHGLIEQYNKFTLSPYFEYYGEVYFNAKNDFLNFKGNAKVIHTCSTKPYWFYFRSDINPDSVYLPLDSKLHSDIALNKARIFADILISKDSLGLFSSFMSTDPSGTAESIFSMRDSSYYISFSEAKQRYEITNRAKYQDRAKPGNYLELDTKNCIIKGEGKLSYINSLRIDSIGGYGNFRYDLNSGDYKMYTLTYMDFFFNRKAAQIISDKIDLNITAGGVNLTQSSYIQNMNNILGVNGTKRLLDDMSLNAGKPKRFPFELNKTLVFSDIKFVWDKESNSFKSVGKIGVGNIYKNMHNKYLKGYVQITKDGANSKVYIYIETNENEWFFFTFSGGIMRTYSSVTEYNTIIETLKDKDRKIRTKNGIFNYMLTNSDDKDLFIYKFTGRHPATN